MDERDEAMQELAELYALGGLEPAERAAVEAYLANAGCRNAIARGRLLAYALAASVEEQPPASLRERVLALTKSPHAAPASARVTALRPQIWRRPLWLAAAAAIVVIVFVGAWAFETGWLGARTWAVGCTATAVPCTISGRVVASGPSALRLETHGMRALPSGKVYQAWYIRAGAKPTPAPTFKPDASGDATVILPVGAEHGLTVAVTVEPDGGSQAPTTKPFLIASIQ
jgi:anti-sigma-K factor RskA